MQRTVLLPFLLWVAGCLEAEPPPAAACSQCHGSDDNAAPPRALGGGTSTDLVAVGAHQAHLTSPNMGHPLECNECHVVPETKDDPGHIDDDSWFAELTWGPIATGGGAYSPVWDHGAMTCANTECHGGAGATVPAPVWTQLDGSARACGACHGNPPPSPHPASTACADCHPTGNGPEHMNGVVDFGGGGGDTDDTDTTPTSCSTGCHGSGGDTAPPNDLDGHSSTDGVGVGAHQAHLLGSTLGTPVACDECHVVPDAVGDPGHLDSDTDTTPGEAEIHWGTLAKTDGSFLPWDPSANPDDPTCTVYCHGTAALGGTGVSPGWTQVDPAIGCGACHSMPPPPNHPASDACEGCHSSVAGPNHTIIDPSRHINGALDF
jgi:predicted CxxxxCH...CXXCH cytochrome family protein